MAFTKMKMTVEDVRTAEGGLILELLFVAVLIPFGLPAIEHPERVEVTHS